MENDPATAVTAASVLIHDNSIDRELSIPVAGTHALQFAVYSLLLISITNCKLEFTLTAYANRCVHSK